MKNLHSVYHVNPEGLCAHNCFNGQEMAVTSDFKIIPPTCLRKKR